MPIAIAVIGLAFGIALLTIGADVLVRGACNLARRLGVSDLAIGLTVVSFGTSAPELVVNIAASFRGSGDIVFGNVVGSNIANILLILGVAGMIRPLPVQRSTVWQEVPQAFAAGLLVWLLSRDSRLFAAADDVISRLDGALLLAVFAGFLSYVWRMRHTSPNTDAGQTPLPCSPWWALAQVVAGLAMLAIGGEIVVEVAIALARMLGVSERVIGLTIVAIGTSLPEMATSAVAAWRRKSDIAVGNVVGSNIFNLLFILGISALCAPIHYRAIFDADVALMQAATLLLWLLLILGRRGQLVRKEAGLLFAMYMGYLAWLLYHGG